MKALRYNKVLGLSIGEQSLLAAEVVNPESPEVRRLTEFVYPVGANLQQPEALGKALAIHLDKNGFTAKTTVVGIPARWLVVKSKEIPPADRAMVSDMLRLQAEGEFSSELKELVYDYAGAPSVDQAGTVLLMATPRTSVDAIVALCASARLNLVALTPTAVALGSTTGQSGDENALVLAVGSGGMEMTAQHGQMPLGLRHFRSASGDRPITGELRRAFSSFPLNGVNRQMILWDDTGLDADALAKSLNLTVRPGQMSDLGVASTGVKETEAGKYAVAIATALVGMSAREPVVDFLHSRLATPKAKLIPRWAMMVALAAAVLIAGGIYAWTNLQNQESRLADVQHYLQEKDSEIKSAEAFVSKVSFARKWQNDDARYVACLRDLTAAFPDDGQTYSTSLIVKEAMRAVAGGKTQPTGFLSGQLYGKTADQQRVQALIDQIKKAPAFADVKLGGTQDAGRSKEVSFSVTFTYHPTTKEGP